jgi:CubicO group peptidase (beta-lactamase class C family)
MLRHPAYGSDGPVVEDMASAGGGVPPIDRRRLLGLAAGSATALAGLGGIARPVGTQAVTARSGRMARDLQEFERRCDLLRQALAIPGMSIAVLHAQELVLARGFGIVDLTAGTPAAADTPYPIASLTKTFAAAVIMRLVEAGKLDVDEAMVTYDPDYRSWCERIKDLPEARNYNCTAERITVRHHLTHTAQGKPGTAYAYNGFLFARLSAVVDAVSPRGFKRAVEEDILEALGMHDTALGAGDPNKTAVIARMAKPYALDRDWTLTPPAVLRPPLDYFSAASGLISTVLDLAKYDIAIDRDQVYSPDAKRQVWTRMLSPTGARLPYGLGWFVWELRGRAPMPWHYGYYTDASSALLLKVPDRQLTLILLASSDRASSPFGLGIGDPVRSPFVTAFLDAVAAATEPD